MTIPIQDWVVEVDISTSKAEKKLKRFNNLINKIDSIAARATSKQSSRLDNQNKTLQKQNQLEAQRLSLRKKIAQAESVGIKDLKRERGALGGTNPVKIRSQVLELDKKITAERQKQKRISMEQSLEKTKVAPQRKFQFTDEKQLRTLNTIDAVVRRAGKGLGETSEEFRKINEQANRLKSRIKSIDSPRALEQLRNSIRILREDTTTLTAATNRQNAALQRQKFIANSTKDSIRNLARSYVSVFAAIESGRFVFNTVKQFDSLNASLLASSGSAEQAAKDFKFIENNAVRLGVRLSDVADGWRQIGAAGRFSNLTTEQTKDVFLAATEASRAFGLSADRTGLVYLAFSQILS